MEKIIEFDSWNRKDLFNFFNNMKDPFYGVSFNIDVTKLYEFHKKNNVSFYLSLVWVFGNAINSIDAFHYDFNNEKKNIVYLDERIPSFTVAGDEHLFKIVNLSSNKNIIDFINEAKELSLSQEYFINLDEQQNNLIYLSSIPWVDETSFKSEGILGAKDNIPRINWGKYKMVDNKVTLNVTLEINHAFIDGYHIGEFNKKIDEIINNL